MSSPRTQSIVRSSIAIPPVDLVLSEGRDALIQILAAPQHVRDGGWVQYSIYQGRRRSKLRCYVVVRTSTQPRGTGMWESWCFDLDGRETGRLQGGTGVEASIGDPGASSRGCRVPASLPEDPRGS